MTCAMTCLVLQLTACSQDAGQMLLRRDFAELQIRHKNLQKEKEELVREKQDLLTRNHELGEKFQKSLEENDVLIQENEALQNDAFTVNLMNDPLFAWAWEAEWDMFEIESDGQVLSLEPQMRTHIRPHDFIGTVNNGFAPEAMSAIGRYRFVKNGATYEIEVFGRNLFKYGDGFYACSEDVTAPILAFLPPKAAWLESDDLLACLYESPLVVMETPLFLPSWRIQGLALSLGRHDVVPAPAADSLGNKGRTIQFYLYGKSMTMEFYPEYVHLQKDKKELWIRTSAFGSGETIFTAG